MIIIKILLAVVTILYGASGVPFNRNDHATYQQQRRTFIQNDASNMIGSDITLTPEEEIVNQKLMEIKSSELETAFRTLDFPPSEHFFSSKAKIEQSNVFKLIRKMPKGAVLHAHNHALTSVHWIVSNITYWPNLYMCLDQKVDQLHFRFYPKDKSCDWQLVSDARTSYSSVEEFDDFLYSRLSYVTPNPQEKYPDINTSWKFFEKKFVSIAGMFSYTKAAKIQLHRALEEFMDDGVSYIEFRGVLSPLHEEDGSLLTMEESVRVLKDAVEEFLAEKKFFGAKLIVSPRRSSSFEDISEYIEKTIELKELLPDFVLGFDLVGQEDLGTPLLALEQQLMKLYNHDPPIPMFFHAGETNWFGASTDDNLFDALLLNATRIGHGYAISKHPAAMEAAIRNGVAIEVCPITHQVLNLVKDLRNHPATFLAAQSFPMVIASDGPALWDALPLSHDFYEAFMAIGGAKADLRFLKKLILNSIKYSGLKSEEKVAYEEFWQKQWTAFITKELNEGHNEENSDREEL